MYLLDSDVIIDYLKGVDEVVDTVNKVNGEHYLSTSIICVGEILEGLYYTKKEERKNTFLKFLDTLRVYSVGFEVIDVFARERLNLRKKGNLIDNFDLLIASTCLVNNLTLLTGNYRHFARIEDLKIYKKFKQA